MSLRSNISNLARIISSAIIVVGLVYNLSIGPTKDNITPYVSDAVAALVDPNVPIFYVRPYHCSAYATIAANILGLNYAPANAWDLPKKNHVLWSGEAYSLEDLISKYGKEPPIGAILGLYNPSSSFNSEEREFTHVAVYIGNSKIIHQYGYFILSSDLNTFLNYSGSRIRKVIVPNDKDQIDSTITTEDLIDRYIQLFKTGIYFVIYHNN